MNDIDEQTPTQKEFDNAVRLVHRAFLLPKVPDELLADLIHATAVLGGNLFTRVWAGACVQRQNREIMDKLLSLHSAQGEHCPACDFEGGNNPDCEHFYRHCYSCKTYAYPCPTRNAIMGK